ncbi:AMP-binding protein [Wenzhouxiangella sp. XN79A]|uniref:fatty acid CoA ligase family protein n=1 Tax=Wenzhouxiangella sp. XN79A TaxID=2724193 RepID=UPI00144AF9B5|nr:AMP-binding protein [Wenzhouxiangella sp. XN79A]
MTELVNIAEALTRQARSQPDAVALILPTRRIDGRWADRRYSYRQLDDLSDRLAAGLQAQGYPPGTRVAFMVPPSLEFFALFFALFKAGLVPVLVDPGIGLKPLKACLGEARPEVFIGITRAQLARMLLGWGRGSIKQTVTVGPRPFGQGLRYRDLLGGNATDFRPPEVRPDDMAAILFTSGSTGIPKGVVYRHRHFVAQVRLMRETFGMSPGEVDLPTFPPFALFDPALGMTTVIPKMDFTRPARADPDMLESMIRQYAVTNLFGSPALMNTLSRHLEAHDLTLPTIRRALSAGAPVSPRVVERMLAALAPHADLHTPYGATECLPVATISGRELLDGPSDGNRNGQGVCVGRPLAANTIRIIRITDRPIEKLSDSSRAGKDEIGEICVSGPTVTDAYWQREAQTRLAKMTDEDGTVWHRMGDLGWMDDDGRLWYCGRKSERVITETGTLFTECVEGRVNAIHGVARSALVGAGDGERKRPVVIVEPEPGMRIDALVASVRDQLEMHAATAGIRDVLTYRELPTDIRHNAKIRRPWLAAWATARLGRKRAAKPRNGE